MAGERAEGASLRGWRRRWAGSPTDSRVAHLDRAADVGRRGLARRQGWLACDLMVGCCWVPAEDAGMTDEDG